MDPTHEGNGFMSNELPSHEGPTFSQISLMHEVEHIGDVVIANDVVAVIAGIAAAKVSGVTGMSGGIAEDIARRVSGRNSSKGVAVEINDKFVKIDLRVWVEYGIRINEVCRLLQQEVKQSVESMTSLYVSEVNVKVDGVELASDPE